MFENTVFGRLDQKLQHAIKDAGYEAPTPIQEKAIPYLLDGRDLIGCAQTGTGKTAAYLLPVLNQLNKGTYPADAINCVIMSPTRELAQQIDQQMEGFSYFMPASSVAVSSSSFRISLPSSRSAVRSVSSWLSAVMKCCFRSSS